ncbi:hypothetical protein KSC_019030 [Ktedonobacter sp. SOSP1-52]|uniref:hypothetical protein n=1 Tax=unclassified Ktedonobacter TaxID=388461 RepID=UPI001A302338|nr:MULTISPECIES: hypothetical protein [unclassified Ktedonobacter]GHO63011.1 hypothetical protein KSC_019030 [Ktedonobacter sp. SOSP1-52]
MSRLASEPLRALTEEEQKELQRVSRASSEPRIRHQRAVALLAVAEGKSLSARSTPRRLERPRSSHKGDQAM